LTKKSQLIRDLENRMQSLCTYNSTDAIKSKEVDLGDQKSESKQRVVVLAAPAISFSQKKQVFY
jgi:hypothetical protein